MFLQYWQAAIEVKIHRRLGTYDFSLVLALDKGMWRWLKIVVEEETL